MSLSRRGLTALELLVAAVLGIVLLGVIATGGQTLVRTLSNVDRVIAEERVRNNVRASLDCKRTMDGFAGTCSETGAIGSEASFRNTAGTIFLDVPTGGVYQRIEGLEVGAYCKSLGGDGSKTFQVRSRSGNGDWKNLFVYSPLRCKPGRIFTPDETAARACTTVRFGKPTSESFTEVGAGTQADPYQISSALQLNDLGRCGCGKPYPAPPAPAYDPKQFCNKFFLLTADLDFSVFETQFYYPIGAAGISPPWDQNAWKGVIDGNNHKITGLHWRNCSNSSPPCTTNIVPGASGRGIIGYGMGMNPVTFTRGTVKNLVIESPLVDTNDIAGTASIELSSTAFVVGAGEAFIDNVHITGARMEVPPWTTQFRTGGFVGAARWATIQNSSINLTWIHKATYGNGRHRETGGAVGGGLGVDMTNVNITLDVDFGAANLFGGAVGTVSSSGIILNNVNVTFNGAKGLTLADYVSSPGQKPTNIGGLIGGLTNPVPITISNCSATGKIVGNAPVQSVGGLVGGVVTPFQASRVTISNSTANVEFDLNQPGNSGVGGLVGSVSSTAVSAPLIPGTFDLDIQSSTFQGAVATSEETSNFGGLVGEYRQTAAANFGSVRILNSTARMNPLTFDDNGVNPLANAGGLVGALDARTLTFTSNFADIPNMVVPATPTFGFDGGFFGFLDNRTVVGGVPKTRNFTFTTNRYHTPGGSLWLNAYYDATTSADQASLPAVIEYQ